MTDPTTDSCDDPAFGTPNYVTGLGTNHVLLEAPYLKAGTYYLLTEELISDFWFATTSSEPFTIRACDADGGRCDATAALAEVANRKAASERVTAGARAFCTAFKIREIFDTARSVRSLGSANRKVVALELNSSRASARRPPPTEIALARAGLIACDGGPVAWRGTEIAVETQAPPPSVLDVLSAREREVAERVADGDSNRRVAARLGISARTVEDHVARICRKMQLPSRAAIGRRIAEQ